MKVIGIIRMTSSTRRQIVILFVLAIAILFAGDRALGDENRIVAPGAGSAACRSIDPGFAYDHSISASRSLGGSIDPGFSALGVDDDPRFAGKSVDPGFAVTSECAASSGQSDSGKSASQQQVASGVGGSLVLPSPTP